MFDSKFNFLNVWGIVVVCTDDISPFQDLGFAHKMLSFLSLALITTSQKRQNLWEIRNLHLMHLMCCHNIFDNIPHFLRVIRP